MWYAVYDKTTGALKATGTVLSQKLPATLGVKEFDFNPQEGFAWDKASLTFIEKPTVVTFNSSNLLMYLTPQEVVSILTASGMLQTRIEELVAVAEGVS